VSHPKNIDKKYIGTDVSKNKTNAQKTIPVSEGQKNLNQQNHNSDLKTPSLYTTENATTPKDQINDYGEI
jgi:hypothetical protein